MFCILLAAGCAQPPVAAAPPAKIEPVAYVPAPNLTLPTPPVVVPMVPGPNLSDLALGPSHFEGLDAKEVEGALGDPNFLRREAPAEVWQYYGPGCILDLFLYAAPGGERVAHAELRGRGEGQPAEASCLSRLIDSRHGQKPS